jgi:hypothetical protein
VKHDLGPVDHPRERPPVEDVGLDELDTIEEVGEVLAPARGEVVDHPHPIAAGEQRAYEGRADEAGPARDQGRGPPSAVPERRRTLTRGRAPGAANRLMSRASDGSTIAFPQGERGLWVVELEGRQRASERTASQEATRAAGTIQRVRLVTDMLPHYPTCMPAQLFGPVHWRSPGLMQPRVRGLG